MGKVFYIGFTQVKEYDDGTNIVSLVLPPREIGEFKVSLMSGSNYSEFTPT